MGMWDMEGAMIKVGKSITEEIMGPIITDFQKDIIHVEKELTRVHTLVSMVEAKVDRILELAQADDDDPCAGWDTSDEG